jgi:hypothetical protein
LSFFRFKVCERRQHGDEVTSELLLPVVEQEEEEDAYFATYFERRLRKV